MHRPLSQRDLLPDGPLSRLGGSLTLLAETDSTNSYVLNRAEALPDGAVVVAEYQTAGRGRMGRGWAAPRGSSLLLSVLLREEQDSPRLALATLLAAAAVCEAIESASDCAPALRWPNDVTLNGRKVAGVLAESRPLPGDHGQRPRRALVVGVGVNCLQQAGHFSGELAQRATSLEIASRQVIDRADVGHALLRALDEHLRVRSGDETNALVRRAITRYCGELGAHVVLRCDGREYRGTVIDISVDGALGVQLDDGGRRRFAPATTSRLW
ncbi:MAG TPA: biotin--[acetyl-CoA-carboxylase] ligase [Phycisphaerae bacterium]|nr:biotin--[acetyl-CoA-carboxylase] ligase [Phycisphaerae bacterium]